jgi:hypothetical protein
MREVGEDGPYEGHCRRSVLVQSNGTHFHGYMRDALSYELSKKLMEGVAIGSGEGGGEGFAIGLAKDRADKPRFIAGFLPKLIEVIGSGAFAVSACYADDVELPSGMAKPRTTEVAIS